MFPEHVSLVFLTTSHLLEAEKKTDKFGHFGQQNTFSFFFLFA